MRRSLSLGVLLLLMPIPLLANEKDPNNCHDPSVWQDWEERAATYPDDLELQTLHALWMGLCTKIDQGALDFAQGMVIFERARDALIQQRRDHRKEQQQQNPL